MRTRAAACLLLAVLLGGCGGGGDPGPVLSKTAARLGQIRSGTITLRLHVDPSGDRSPFGFELQGPFALGKPGSLPVADVRYTQIANGRRATVTLISTGRNAYVETRGRTYMLPPTSVESLRSSNSSLRSNGGLGALRVDDWIEDASLSGGGDVGGAETDHVSARLDTAAAVADLVRIGGVFGGSQLRSLSAHSRKQIDEATKSATLDLYSGKTDHLLRKLDVGVEFDLDVPQDLRAALGDAVGAKIDVELEIDHPNRRVHVLAPASALPYTALGASG